MGGYTTAGSGKSMARALFAIIVLAVMAGFDIAMWKGRDPNAAWATIISALTVPLGGAWVFGKWNRKSNAKSQANNQIGEQK